MASRNIVVVGAGDVGYYLCQIFSEQGHYVTVIENDEHVAADVDDNMNARVITDNGVSAEVLNRANVSECEFFLAMTSDDRTNLLACSLARAMGAKTIIARIHDQTYSEHAIVNYQLHFGIDYLLNPEALCAVELVKTIRNPGRVAVENFARGQIEVQMLTISHRSKHVGESLRDMSLDQGVRLVYLQRGKHAEVPSADTVMEAGDKITLIGPSDILYQVRPEFEPESKPETMHVTIFGGSETAIAMVRLLNNDRFRIRIIENDGKLCRRLAENFPNVIIIHGSATSLRLMEEEHIGDSDYFVACTKRDEDNIMTCLQAAKLGAKHVQLVINKPDYEDVLDSLSLTLGVDLAVAPRVVTVNEVRRITSDKPYVELASLPGDKASVIEIQTTHASKAAGKSLKEVSWPPECLIASILHKFEARMPGAEDKILAGDRVVAIVSRNSLTDLVRILAP